MIFGCQISWCHVHPLIFILPYTHFTKQIDESGHVTGIIDLEGTTIAPLWESALLPRWLGDSDDPESTFEGGSAESRQTLRALFF
jgi:hypothetical protein